MTRHDDPAVQAAYDGWTESLVELADHELDCSGCRPFTQHCPEGQRLKAVDEERHRAWSEARMAGVAA